MKTKVLAAMSGGVDSSAAAALLLEAGYEVEGAYMKNWINEDEILGECPWEEDIRDARAVAEKLKIPFRIVNLIDAYRSRVVDYLLTGYQAGVTPNPDVMCNREIKFGVFQQYAHENGFDAIATGHYARLEKSPEGETLLLEGCDKNKDQSYFLALLRQEQITHALFPIGHLQKSEVRKKAAELGLPTATKKDSQGICFIGKVKMSDFLRAYVPDDPGPVYDTSGKKLGDHPGLHYFTLGQRKGIRIASNSYGDAWVVVAKRAADKALIVAFDRPDSPGLYAQNCKLETISFCGKPLAGTCEILCRPRYRAKSVPATITLGENGSAHLHFHTPQRALTPGQICALYHGEQLLGGGIFTEIDHEDSSIGTIQKPAALST